MGYAPPFIENYMQIVDVLIKNEDTLIEVVAHKDSICKACPHLGTRGCSTEEKIQVLDRRHAQILNLKVGDHVSWKNVKQRLKDHMTLEQFHVACAGCEWKAWGVCEEALKKL
jgi:hypothetical protein